METLFNEIATKEGGTCKVIHEKAYAPYIFLPYAMRENGAQIKELILTIPYKSQIITARYELSNNYRGQLHVAIKTVNEPPDFQISNNSHFRRIFNRKMNILKVQCKDESWSNKIQLALQESGLEETAKNHLFEPDILAESRTDKGYEICSTFHLSFPEKKVVLYKFICFYKHIISLVDASRGTL